MFMMLRIMFIDKCTRYTGTGFVRLISITRDLHDYIDIRAYVHFSTKHICTCMNYTFLNDIYCLIGVK